MITSLPLILVGLSMLAACYTVFAFVADSGKRQLSRRARQLGGIDKRKNAKTAGPALRRDSYGTLDTIIHKILPRPEAVRLRLAASGTAMTIGRYGLICMILAVTVVVILLLRGLSSITALLLGVFAGLWLPHAYIGFLINRRKKRFTRLFPEAIGLIVRGLRAGLPVSETIVVVGAEVADPLGEEFRRVADQVKLGQPLEEAMWAVGRRLDMAEFNFLIITLSVQRETGGNLAETLENLEEILRKREQMRLKVKAMSSEAKASAGIIGSLPFVMTALLYVVSHDYIMSLFTSGLGHVMLAVGLGCMSIGVFVMAQMVKFEI